MTFLTNTTETANQNNLFADLIAALPKGAELVEAVAVLACGALMTLLLNAML
ncbi:hypothetical protein [Niveispirillum irakense]|uniref:hypothetical protein n=1 Tax=Niveispirillum irakense TaxID=34011 RepID=UPI000421E4FB|nr:hypothetical protein [Niveispirillum irakense]